jgi:hypothetical protein
MGREELKLRARWLAEWAGMVTCIEPSIGSTFGAPDVHLVNETVDGFAEFKVVEAEGTFDIRKNQRLWHLRYQKYKPNSCFVVLCQQGFWALPSKMAIVEQRVHGSPVNWDCIRSGILSYALRTVFRGDVFNRDSIEHLLEPLAQEGLGCGQAKIQGGRTSTGASQKMQI